MDLGEVRLGSRQSIGLILDGESKLLFGIGESCLPVWGQPILLGTQRIPDWILRNMLQTATSI
jgi:hypothetical protein